MGGTIPALRAHGRRPLSVGERDRYLYACRASERGWRYRRLVDAGMRPLASVRAPMPDVDLAASSIDVQRTLMPGAGGSAERAEPTPADSAGGFRWRWT